jgi:hypothetical protein
MGTAKGKGRVPIPVEGPRRECGHGEWKARGSNPDQAGTKSGALGRTPRWVERGPGGQASTRAKSEEWGREARRLRQALAMPTDRNEQYRRWKKAFDNVAMP